MTHLGILYLIHKIRCGVGNVDMLTHNLLGFLSLLQPVLVMFQPHGYGSFLYFGFRDNIC